MIALALAAALAGPTAIESCDWSHPGASPYTGTTTAAIMAMPLPLDVRQRLAARPLDSYDHFAVVDRDSIRTTGAEFAPDIAFLNFGTGKRVCAGVDRRGWSPEHVETAIVYCDSASGWCVGKFAVCGNWAIFTRLDSAPPPLPPAALVGAPPVLAALPPGPFVPFLPPEGLWSVPGTPPSFEGWSEPVPWPIWGGAGGGGFYGSPGGGGGVLGGPPVVYFPTPVPEPSAFWLLGAGLALVAGLRKRLR